MRFRLHTFLGLSLVSAIAIGASVPNTFTAGDIARAADMNANFQALVSAVTSLENRVTALEAPAPITMATIAGTYKYASLEVELFGAPGVNGNASANGGALTGTVTLDANGTFSGSISGGKTSSTVSINQAPSHSHAQPGGGQTGPAQVGSTVSAALANNTENDSPTGTWTISNGEVVVNDSSGDAFTFQAVAGGKMLIGVHSRQDSGGGFYGLNLLTRQ